MKSLKLECPLDISYKRNWKEFILNVFVNTSQYMGGIVSYLVLAIPIFTNIYAEETPAELAQLITSYSFKCQYLIYFFTRLYNILNEVSIIAGNSHRVGELIDQMQYANENSNKPKHVGAIENEICLNVKNLNVMIPDNSKCLVKNLNMIFKRNENILITGRSGCGKTSLFRCLSGLWKSYNGQIIINDQQAKYLFFLPQNSYFPSGSLIDQITYPSVLIGNQLTINESVQDEILSWLNKFNLEHLLSLVKNDLFHQASFNWSSVLSAGNFKFSSLGLASCYEFVLSDNLFKR
jgi:ATP-binding cassette subfamily D (ALD) protein 4